MVSLIRPLYTQISDQTMDSHHDIKFYLQKFSQRSDSSNGQQVKGPEDVVLSFTKGSLGWTTEGISSQKE